MSTTIKKASPLAASIAGIKGITGIDESNPRGVKLYVSRDGGVIATTAKTAINDIVTKGLAEIDRTDSGAAFRTHKGKTWIVLIPAEKISKTLNDDEGDVGSTSTGPADRLTDDDYIKFVTACVAKMAAHKPGKDKPDGERVYPYAMIQEIGKTFKRSADAGDWDKGEVESFNEAVTGRRTLANRREYIEAANKYANGNFTRQPRKGSTISFDKGTAN